MASGQDSAQEPTEQPTERRLEEARKQGQVPRSKELNTMLTLLAAALALVFMGELLVSNFVSVIASALSLDRELAFDQSLLINHAFSVLLNGLLSMLPFFAVMVLAAFAGPVLMGGLSFSAQALAFKLEKLNPVKGLKRIFAVKGLLELLKALIKFFLLSAVAVTIFALYQREILQLPAYTAVEASRQALRLLSWSFVALSSAMIVIVSFDVPFELWNHSRQLKMTLQQIRDEMKDTEGRPEVKSRIRSLQREMSQRRMMEQVPNADVVITNPTHFAVALAYDDAPGSAPRVVAKGRDLMALKIRSVATENEVAIYSAPPLARALYASTEIGVEIPPNLYLAVAKVLAYLHQLRHAASTEYVPRPSDVEVPEEYSNLFDEEEQNGGE